MTRRVLITGSRELVDPEVVYRELEREVNNFLDVTVVHGACPQGADFFAAQWCEFDTHPRVKVEAHPAQWGRDCSGQCFHKPRYRNGRLYCPVAGHLRNEHMVSLGADIVYAFPRGRANGTWDCILRAKKKGLTVWFG